ncbi:type II toxin-antitoxin system YafQ family toxin [Acidithiobacillus sp. VAN18-1]|uniref:Type II toxin-antitoxin system YafQ family toxin n=1 Tax=Igneacidithiobacillus copahuensis TaxID=2724909 RepID=A0AAE3CKG1_9PROT|nr:type II toxin-antitoxin system YafQ family toxin [Igneacidithiobacillus copahuensis]MBU2788734.1 type II toxin-antitoxin system YafQ family toxin [Igneacidithiobacillus copahuensis]MBU2797131.1 type II toxin-antitoxin system YafQ family toxin [Acidithiobacillus sp. VAN18-2]
MRRIERTARFKRDYRRELKGIHRNSIDKDLAAVIQLLVSDLELPLKYRDHPLTGDWRDHRDCHIHPDLVLIYRKPDDHRLQLVRLGSHSGLAL